MREAAGKVSITGRSTYQLEKDLLWDTIKKHTGWENEVAADIKVEKTDVFGVYTVKPGDSLSKIAKSAYDDAGQLHEDIRRQQGSAQGSQRHPAGTEARHSQPLARLHRAR